MDRERYFESIYQRYFIKLYTYAKVICNSSEMAKDVVSDLFYNLWKNKVDLYNINNLDVYLTVSVRNQSLKALARNKLEVSDEEMTIIQSTVNYIDPEELLVEKELRIMLEDIVGGLSPQCQLIFRMAKEQGLKYIEIAKELDISPETVKSQLKKAHKTIRTGIMEFYQDKRGTYFPDIKLIGQIIIFITSNISFFLMK